MKNILVTGGAGYIGSVVCKDLIDIGYKVTCLDNFLFGDESIKDLIGNKNFELIKADINSKNDIDLILSSNKFFGLIHLAAIVGDPACKLYKELAIKTNWDASRYIYDCSKKNQVEKFIFASTCSNYGKMDKETNMLDENGVLAPVSLYAELKVKFEKYILEDNNKNENFVPTLLRFATVYGLSPRMRFDLTINQFSKELALEKELLVYGENFWRPYCHVSDFSRAFITILKAKKELVNYEVFNVGDTSENYTKKMIINEICKILPKSKIKYVSQPDDPRDYKVNSDKINKVLGFKVSKKVPEGIDEIIQSIKKNSYEDLNSQFHYNIPVENFK